MGSVRGVSWTILCCWGSADIMWCWAASMRRKATTVRSAISHSSCVTGHVRLLTVRITMILGVPHVSVGTSCRGIGVRRWARGVWGTLKGSVWIVYLIIIWVVVAAKYWDVNLTTVPNASIAVRISNPRRREGAGLWTASSGTTRDVWCVSKGLLVLMGSVRRYLLLSVRFDSCILISTEI